MNLQVPELEKEIEKFVKIVNEGSVEVVEVNAGSVKVDENKYATLMYFIFRNEYGVVEVLKCSCDMLGGEITNCDC